MGFFDDLFGGLFDFDGNGKTTLDEEYIAYKMFEECTKEDNRGTYSGGGYTGKWVNTEYDWREYAEDGSEYGIYPADYEFEYEYEEALEEAKKYEWRNYVKDGSKYGVYPEGYEYADEYEEALEEAKGKCRQDVDTANENSASAENLETEIITAEPDTDNITVNESDDVDDDDENIPQINESDYPNRRSYNAACALNDGCYSQKEKALYDFILQQSETVTAARYLTPDGEFLFAQAVKDNFTLPLTLPDEDERREYEFSDIIKKIARKDIPLCFEIWSWCMEQFLPYAEYDFSAREELTNEALCGAVNISDEFKDELIKYTDAHPEFGQTLIRQADDNLDDLPEVIVRAVEMELFDTAKRMFEDALEKTGGYWKAVNRLMSRVIACAKNYDELETMEFVERNFLPRLENFPNGMVTDEIEPWTAEIAEYTVRVERESDKYAYSRGNAWRRMVPDGKKYDLDPLDYDSESEYLKAYAEAKEESEEDEADEDDSGFAEEFLGKSRVVSRPSKPPEDENIYTYCGVRLWFSPRVFSYRAKDDYIPEIGDEVIVPLGEDDKETNGTVMSVGKYKGASAPYLPDKSKFVIRKA